MLELFSIELMPDGNFQVNLTGDEVSYVLIISPKHLLAAMSNAYPEMATAKKAEADDK